MISADFNSIPIQAAIRGYQARKERDVYLLDKVYRIAAKQILENPDASMRISPEGKTPVYFPDECSEIVIKQAGRACDQRFGQMVQGKQLCNQKGYRHLVIPKMCVIGECLIEERLPLNTHPFEQAQAYLDNIEACTPVIEEFAHFVLQQGVMDLKRDFSMFRGLGSRRVDNFPLFRTPQGHWAIGLIDIELDKDTFTPIKSGEDWDKDNLYVIRKQALCDLIYFYPCHADLIRKVASYYLDEETIAKLPLARAAEDGKRFLQTMVPGFLHYLTNRREMTPEIKEIFIDELMKLLPVKVRRRGAIASVQDDTKDRQAIASYIDGAFQVLADLKAKNAHLSSHPFSQCLLNLYLSQFPNGPVSIDRLGARFLELLEELEIIYHYCPSPPGPGSDTVIF